MREYITTKFGRRILLNTPEEDARIQAAAIADPDAQPVTDAQWKAAKRFTRGGRPPHMQPKKAPVTLRLDVDVLAALRATGKGWQTRVNDIMREWLKQNSA